MPIKLLQWNIGGCLIRQPDADPTNDDSYREDGMAHVSDVIRRFDPDVITLQESYSNGTVQAEEMARALGYPFVVNDRYDRSHLYDGQWLSQAVLSRFPISDHSFELFYNPKFDLVRPNGQRWISHDKGVTCCLLRLPNGQDLELKTYHSIPLSVVDIAPSDERYLSLIRDMEHKLALTVSPAILAGDPNYDGVSLKPFLPSIFSSDDIKEIEQVAPTAPRGTRKDHIVYRGLRLISTTVANDVLTDHYPVFAEFSLSE